jgi:hypothetical protein
VCINGPKEAHRRRKAYKDHNLPRLLERQNYILGRVITDEPWVQQYDPETKRRSAQCKIQFSTTKKVPSVQIKSQNNVADFYIIGIVHYEFVLTGRTGNQVFHLEVLKWLREKLGGNDPKLLPTTHRFCNMKMHLLTQHYLREFLATKQIPVLEHPAYSPDQTPNDFFCYRR